MISVYQPRQGRVTGERSYLTWVPPSPFRDYVACLWQLKVPAGSYHYRSIPDNCVDLIINLDQPGDVILVSPFLSSMIFDLVGPVTYFGIRFQVLGSTGLTSHPVGEWAPAGSQIEAHLLLGRSVCEALVVSVIGEDTFSARCQALLAVLRQWLSPVSVDRRLLRFLRSAHHNPALKLGDSTCADFGLSARQLRRLAQLYLGVSPKAYCRVVRFQSLLHQLQSGSPVPLWQDLYSDQAHFIREFKAMCGFSPQLFNQTSVLYNTGR